MYWIGGPDRDGDPGTEQDTTGNSVVDVEPLHVCLGNPSWEHQDMFV